MSDRDLNILSLLYFLILGACCIGLAAFILVDRAHRAHPSVDSGMHFPTTQEDMRTPPDLDPVPVTPCPTPPHDCKG